MDLENQYEEEEQNNEYENDVNYNEANRLIAMNPSGVIEQYENNPNIECDGEGCKLVTKEKDIVNKDNSYSYIMYFVIFLIIILFGFFFYKKYFCTS